mgnify:CR=1 FL=1
MKVKTDLKELVHLLSILKLKSLKSLSLPIPKKRLLTKAEKNELLEKTKMSFYEERIATGVITLDNAMEQIKSAFQEKQHYEGLGLVLPEKKTEAPYYESEGKRTNPLRTKKKSTST